MTGSQHQNACTVNSTALNAVLYTIFSWPRFHTDIQIIYSAVVSTPLNFLSMHWSLFPIRRGKLWRVYFLNATMASTLCILVVNDLSLTSSELVMNWGPSSPHFEGTSRSLSVYTNKSNAPEKLIRYLFRIIQEMKGQHYLKNAIFSLRNFAPQSDMWHDFHPYGWYGSSI